jgi:hypothetical protein
MYDVIEKIPNMWLSTDLSRDGYKRCGERPPAERGKWHREPLCLAHSARL